MIKKSDLLGTEEPLLIKEVRSSLLGWARKSQIVPKNTIELDNLTAGKMLRTTLAAQLMEPSQTDQYFTRLKNVCIATEIVHTATLFHDDVIDGASIRRGMPTLWKTLTPNSSILIGDLFMSEAVMFIIKTGNINDVKMFMEKVFQVCKSEIKQELVFRGNEPSLMECIDIARSKTGPLFAFTALMCSFNDLKLQKVLEEVGYLIGTAYQLADDLVDEYGCEGTYKKTLGTDRLRRKFTLAQTISKETVHDYIDQLCSKALALLHEWPKKYNNLKIFLEQGFKQYSKVA